MPVDEHYVVHHIYNLCRILAARFYVHYSHFPISTGVVLSIITFIHGSANNYTSRWLTAKQYLQTVHHFMSGDCVHTEQRFVSR